MKVTLKIISFLVMQIFVAITFSTPADDAVLRVSETEKPQEYFLAENYHHTVILGERVVIQNRNRETYATPLVPYASFQYIEEMTMGLYVNGVEAYRLHRWDDSPGDDSFVEIAIAGNGMDAGFSGWIEECHLISPGALSSTLPTVTLYEEAGKEVSLFRDYAEDTPVIATYPSDTEAQLLGYLDEMCHVQIGAQSGFVKTSHVQFPKEVKQGLEDVMPRQFDGRSPSQKHTSEITSAYTYDLLTQYGSRTSWPLWVEAEYAALHRQLGLDPSYSYGTHIMPSPDDLPQEDAIHIAAQAVSERFGIALETVLEQYTLSIDFIDGKREHSGHHWKINFYEREPSGSIRWLDEIYVSSPAGEIVDF